MRVLVLIGSLDQKKGGPVTSTLNLCAALLEHGVNADIFAIEDGSRPATAPGISTTLFKGSFPRCFSNSDTLYDEVVRRMASYDLLHICGIWQIVATRVASAARALGCPYVISTRGMLSAWRRNVRTLHKDLYFRLVEKRMLHSASMIHFLTEIERRDSSAYIGHAPWTVIPNGIWPQEYSGLTPGDFWERRGLTPKPLVVFVGRLSGIKRLDLQCEAFRVLGEKFRDLHWMFIGPDEGMESRIKACMQDSGLSDRCLMPGMLTGREKLSALAAAMVYCHTSTHEGQSVAITEALAAGKPCVLTEGCNFPQVVEANAGFIVPPKVDRIAGAIESILSDPHLRHTMGENARLLATAAYDWKLIGGRMAALYQDILANHNHPKQL